MARLVMRMNHIEDHERDHEGQNHGDDAVKMPRLAVPGKLSLGGLDIKVRGERTICEPSQYASSTKEHKDQRIGGRTHRSASLAMSAHPGGPRTLEIVARQRPYQTRNSLNHGKDLIIAKECFPE